MEATDSSKSKSQNRVAGIIGGGQLAQMLAHAAQKLECRILLYAENNHAPAASFVEETVTGRLDDQEKLRLFFSKLETKAHQVGLRKGVVAIENEFVDCEVLRTAARGFDVQIFPELVAIEKFQDKLNQKEFFLENGIPSARFEKIGDDLSHLQESCNKVSSADLIEGCVLKWSRNGYDGKGVFLPNAEIPYSEASNAARAFCENANLKKIPVYLEERISFRRELAAVFCHSIQGEFSSYPVVVSQQEKGVCKRVFGPAVKMGLTSSQEQEILRWGKILAKRGNLQGTFAIELFEDQNGKLLANEMAPRVHNSGHCTLDSSITSQFENHWRALFGIELGSTHSVPIFGMLNLLGSKESLAPNRIDVQNWLGSESDPSRIRIHWYGKQDMRPGRKMGHVNVLGGELDSIQSMTRLLANLDQKWLNAHS